MLVYTIFTVLLASNTICARKSKPKGKCHEGYEKNKYGECVPIESHYDQDYYPYEDEMCEYMNPYYADEPCPYGYEKNEYGECVPKEGYEECECGPGCECEYCMPKKHKAEKRK